MIRAQQFLNSKSLFVAVCVIGLLARYLAMLRGYNYDFESFSIVGDLAARGLNVYANTERYNYGPIWFNVLGVLYRITSGDLLTFRVLLVNLLSLVDLSIALLLARQFGNLVGAFFFLNPISIIITGCHNQFDNLAILLGLMSVLTIGDQFETPMSLRKVGGLCLLGLSLMTKHILFAFPFWLAVKQKGPLAKAVVVGVPSAVFLLGFVPYWSTGRDGIVQHVFLYGSSQYGFLHPLVVPTFLRGFVSPLALWLGLLAIGAVVYGRRKIVESFLAYTAILVAGTPSMANQYLAIPAAFVVANLNLFTVTYVLLGTLKLMVEPIELHIARLQDALRFDQVGLYRPMVVLLLLAVVWNATRPQSDVCVMTRRIRAIWSKDTS